MKQSHTRSVIIKENSHPFQSVRFQKDITGCHTATPYPQKLVGFVSTLAEANVTPICISSLCTKAPQEAFSSTHKGSKLSFQVLALLLPPSSTPPAIALILGAKSWAVENCYSQHKPAFFLSTNSASVSEPQGVEALLVSASDPPLAQYLISSVASDLEEIGIWIGPSVRACSDSPTSSIQVCVVGIGFWKPQNDSNSNLQTL